MFKNRIIVEAVLAGKSQSQVAKQYGISQPRVSQLMARWRHGGWPALEKQSRRPHSNPKTTPPAVTARILQLRVQLAEQGCDNGAQSIAHALAGENLHVPANSTIWRILKNAGLITPQPKKRPRISYIRFQADLPNECWQSDFTHYRLTNGTDTEILLWLDDHSRYLLRATAHMRVTGTTVLNEFRNTINEHGEPSSTLTDNGFVFTTRTKNAHNAFETELLNRGIQQKNGRPGHPQTQGKVERLNQTLKQWLKAQQQPTTIKELQQLLNQFRNYYNTQRHHRSLHNHATPHQAYHARNKAQPQNKPTNTCRIREDKVGKNGKVTLRRAGRWHDIGLGTEHAGTKIKMLINNLDVTVINTETGEILRELTINPDTDYQPRGIKPGPKKGTPRQGGMPKGYKFKTKKI